MPWYLTRDGALPSPLSPRFLVPPLHKGEPGEYSLSAIRSELSRVIMEVHVRGRIAVLVSLVLSLILPLSALSQELAALPEVPVKGMVTLVDLGAKKCIPCKMMAPILEELTKQYQGKAAIVFVDVWQHMDQAEKYGIRVIPTQIFFDKQGKEVLRHVGFMDKKSIVEVLEKLGVK